MRIYIDTGILRSHSKTDLDSTTAGVPVCVTGHNLVELLGSYAIEFPHIRSALRKTKDLPHDFRLVDDVQAQAFGVTYKFTQERSANLRSLADSLANADSVEAFESAAAQIRGRFGLQYFLTYSTIFETTQAEEIARANLFREEPDRMLLMDSSERSLSFYYPGMTRLLAQYSLRSVAPSVTDDQIRLVQSHYDGSLDTYIRALTYFENRKFATLARARRNDWIDLQHLIYLGPHPGDSILLTDDKLFTSLNSVIPGRILSTPGII